MNHNGTLRIAGYAALFDIADGARDSIRPGAFARTLGEQRAALPLYWQHRPEQRIGTVETIAEDARGLRVIARIDNPGSRAVQALLRREVSGLSFAAARGVWQWADGIDAPLNEEREAYVVGLGAVDQPRLRWELGTPSLTLSAELYAKLLADHPGQPIWVRQIGSFDASPATLVTTLP